MKSLIKNKRLFIRTIALIIGLTLVGLGYGLNFNNSQTPLYIYFLYIFGAIIIFTSTFLIYGIINKNNQLNVKQISLIGVMGALTSILYIFLKFPLPFFPPWLEINFSEIPILITTFAYGPFSGSILVLIKFIIKLPSTITFGVGEFADLILGLVLTITSGLIYKKYHTFKGGIFSMVISMITCSLIAMLINWTILIPAYIKFTNITIEQLVKSLSFIPDINTNNFMICYLFIGVLPFNLFRYTLIFLVTLFLYKRIKFLLDKASNNTNKNTAE